MEKLENGRPLDASQHWKDRACRVIPGGAQTFSKSPMSFVQGVYPNFLKRAEGAYVWDVDGNRYIDYISGLGPIILGAGDPAVMKAAQEQMQDGVSFSLPHPLEVQVAELLCQIIPCAQMVRFGKNGSDVTATAVRVARAFTSREKVACCDYHGWQDWYIGSTIRNRGVPNAVQRLTVRFPYNDLPAIRQLLRAHCDEIACVIMEPVSFEPPQQRYLEGVKEACREAGTLLVFDEIVTGFRFSMGGAQQHFGVIPDLACFGKAIANGFPLSAIVRPADIMRLFDDVFFSFTHGGEALSLSAALATIRELKHRRGPEMLWKAGAHLKHETNSLLAQLGISAVIQCVGLPPFTTLKFDAPPAQDALALRSLFQQEAAKRGLLTQGSHMLTLAHDRTVLGETLRVYREVFEVLGQAMARGDVRARLEGPPVRPILCGV